MAHEIKKMDHSNPIPASTIICEYFCNYWGLPEGSPLLCSLGDRDSCDNCPYLQVRIKQKHIQPQTRMLYTCRVISQPIKDPMSKCSLPSPRDKKYCHQCPYLEISTIEETVCIPSQQPEPDFYVSNPDFLEIG